MLGKNAKNFPEATLLDRYRRDTGDDEAALPERLI